MLSDDTNSLRHLPIRSSKNCDLELANTDRLMENYSIDDPKCSQALGSPLPKRSLALAMLKPLYKWRTLLDIEILTPQSFVSHKSFASRLFRVKVAIQNVRVFGDLVAALLLQLFVSGHLNMAAVTTVRYS